MTAVEPSATLGPIVLSDLQKTGHGYFPVLASGGDVEGILRLADVSDIAAAKKRSTVSELLFRPKPLPPSRLERIPKLLRRPTQTLVRSSLGQTLIGLARRMKPAPTPEGHDPESHGASLPPGFEAGAWFVDVEAAWWNEPNRSVWLQAIHRAGRRPASTWRR